MMMSFQWMAWPSAHCCDLSRAATETPAAAVAARERFSVERFDREMAAILLPRATAVPP